jgi:hypothetical protein
MPWALSVVLSGLGQLVSFLCLLSRTEALDRNDAMEEPLHPPDPLAPLDRAHPDGPGRANAGNGERDAPLDPPPVLREGEQFPRHSSRKKSSFVARYFCTSVVLMSGMLYHTMRHHEQFYPAVEYLGASRVSLFLMGNVGFSASLLGYKGACVVCLMGVYHGWTLSARDVEACRGKPRHALSPGSM